MSINPNIAGGLASKPRNAEPSMFQILSWAGQIQELKAQQFEAQNENCQCCIQNKCCCSSKIKQTQIQPVNKTISSPNVKFAYNEQEVHQNQNTTQQVYKQHHSPKKQQISPTKQTGKIITQSRRIVNNSMKKSTLYPKEVIHELYSYDPVNLKASRSKSAVIVPKDNIKEVKKVQKQEILDENTILQRKQRIKQFQIFTRALPNSAFTTYYGKPAFQNYGRGSSYKNLKSYNVMPHRGDNHPKHLESHYSALIKGRHLKSKSYMPRKPVQQVIVPAVSENQKEQNVEINLPIQKPNLVNSVRFSTVVSQTGPKQGPPYVKRNLLTIAQQKYSKNGKKAQNKQNKGGKGKNKTQTVKNGSKQISERQNLIDLLEQKKLKASQLAYKVTQCYPLDWNGQRLCQSVYVQHSQKPAGKHSNKGDPVSQLIQMVKPLQQSNS